jgi:hypothetical protein
MWSVIFAHFYEKHSMTKNSEQLSQRYFPRPFQFAERKESRTVQYRKALANTFAALINVNLTPRILVVIDPTNPSYYGECGSFRRAAPQ